MTTATPMDRVDPSVKVPAAVARAAARAEELSRAQSGAPAETPAETPAENTETPPAEAPASADTTFTASVSAETPKAPDTKHSAPVSEESWEQRYKAMKGRFEREQGETRRLAEEIGNLHRMMAELQATRNAPNPETQFSKLVTPEEEYEYGQEFLGVVGKKAKEELVPEIKALEAKIAHLQGQLQGVTSQNKVTAQENMYRVLGEQVPNWKELNSNPEFLAWLNLPDAYSGAIRKELLNAAYSRGDASRVAAFFKGFISDEAVTNPAMASAERNVTPTSNKPSLESMAAPGRAKTAAPSGPAEKPFFTRAELSQFYSDVQRGVYRGREAEKEQMEAKIFAAQREGRIR